MRYYTKTRNWNGEKWIEKMLNLSKHFGGNCYISEDHDSKYIFESNNLLKCLLVFAFYLIFTKVSGGWTYIKDTTKEKSMNEYGYFYL